MVISKFQKMKPVFNTLSSYLVLLKILNIGMANKVQVSFSEKYLIVRWWFHVVNT